MPYEAEWAQLVRVVSGFAGTVKLMVLPRRSILAWMVFDTTRPVISSSVSCSYKHRACSRKHAYRLAECEEGKESRNGNASVVLCNDAKILGEVAELRWVAIRMESYMLDDTLAEISPSLGAGLAPIKD